MAVKKSKNPALEVAKAIDRAWNLVHQGLYDDAWAVLVQVREVAQREGFDSPPFLMWTLAVVADHRDDPENAVRFIVLARKGDPCAPPILASHRVICRRVRSTFDALPAADIAVATLYTLLRELDAADGAAALKYSQCAVANGDYETALASAQYAVEAEPPNAERLYHLARLLRAAGQEGEARARIEEAENLGVSFPCPRATA